MNTVKTSTSDLINRYIWLASTIFASGRITFSEIATKWNHSHWNHYGTDLPLRTFHDHRKAVENLFDIVIECDKKDGFRYYIENSNDIGSGQLRKWMLSNMAVRNLLAESKAMRSRILLEDIPSGLNWLTLILEAMMDNRLMKMKHKSFWRDIEYEFMIEPYCLKLFHQRWYVCGRQTDVGQTRVYALDRLIFVETLQETFTIPEDFDGELFFSDYFGVFADPQVQVENVKLKVSGAHCNYLRSLPLHHSQTEIDSNEEWSIFQYRIRPTRDFINTILGMCEYTKVLEPQWMVETIRQRIRDMAKNYGISEL